jgi:hypothetical protein
VPARPPAQQAAAHGWPLRPSPPPSPTALCSRPCARGSLPSALRLPHFSCLPARVHAALRLRSCWLRCLGCLPWGGCSAEMESSAAPAGSHRLQSGGGGGGGGATPGAGPAAAAGGGVLSPSPRRAVRLDGSAAAGLVQLPTVRLPSIPGSGTHLLPILLPHPNLFELWLPVSYATTNPWNALTRAARVMGCHRWTQTAANTAAHGQSAIKKVLRRAQE